MLQALLVDDELNNLESLDFLLTHDCEGIEVAGKVTNAAQARKWLQKRSVDVIFLDISMPGENGFEFLASLDRHDFNVIFVTAFDQYAIQAIKASALDYLLKPVSISELQKAVEKVNRAAASPSSQTDNGPLLTHLLQTVHRQGSPTKIALPHLGGITFISVAEIVSLQADSNYTIIHLKDMQKMVITKTLKDFEDILDPNRFARIHKSYLVNLEYIREYNTIDGGLVKMIDGNQWSISRRQIEPFMEKMRAASLMFGK
jgi:two-component system LytT family response regulator